MDNNVSTNLVYMPTNKYEFKGYSSCLLLYDDHYFKNFKKIKLMAMTNNTNKICNQIVLYLAK